MSVRRVASVVAAWAAASCACPPAVAGPLETSLGGFYSQPLGPLRGASRSGAGLWAGLAMRRDSTPWLAGRVEAGFVSHPVGGTIDLLAPDGGPSRSSARITDRVMWLTLGPQAERAFGRTLGYAWVTAGLGRTEIHPTVSSAGGDTYFPETFDDPPSRLTFAWTAGAGWRTPLRPDLRLDLSAAFVNLGRAPLAADPPLAWTRTQRERIVTQTPDPHPSIVALRVGITFVPGGRERREATAPSPAPPAPRPGR